MSKPVVHVVRLYKSLTDRATAAITSTRYILRINFCLNFRRSLYYNQQSIRKEVKRCLEKQTTTFLNLVDILRACPYLQSELVPAQS
ncbi:hypothetical protein CHS0354_017960 [Potamilus streckersoni]|uniref:Uncharacterized protein n=1 Tax=Potamilus streckersoni TaxID=2493646 RepID=A0AAE0VJZ2_9BIVA|nr:hypothetical protein CHS0354_017960 [Potamilus streckersoni]